MIIRGFMFVNRVISMVVFIIGMLAIGISLFSWGYLIYMMIKRVWQRYNEYLDTNK
jgi:hypothetical protein